MRPFTTQCWTLSLELPMGCCCSNSKIQPESDKRREAVNTKQVLNSVFAPPAITFCDLTKVEKDRPHSAFSFGGSDKPKKLHKGRSKRTKRSSSSSSSIEERSSGTEVRKELTEDIRNYNKIIADQRKGLHSGKSKVPKTKGFDFPIFHPTSNHGDPNQKAVSGVSAVAAANLALDKLKKDRRPFLDEDNGNSRGYRRKSLERYPSVHSHGRKHHKKTVVTETLHYKRLDDFARHDKSMSRDDEYTGVSSDEEEVKQGRTYRNGVQVQFQKKIVAVKRKNAQTQYYKQTYTRSRQSFNSSKSSRPSSKKSLIRSDDLEDENENYRERLLEQVCRPSTASSRSGPLRLRVKEQRLYDSYLAQPKALLVPVIRDRKPLREVRYSSSRPRQRKPVAARKILKKPWRIPSEKSRVYVPKVAGLTSSSVKFAADVNVRRIGGDEDEISELHSDKNSSTNLLVEMNKRKDDISDNEFTLRRYLKKSGTAKYEYAGRLRTAFLPKTTSSSSVKNLGVKGEVDTEELENNNEHYVLTSSPTRYNPR